MTDPTPALTRQMLAWLAEAPRPYDEVMAAWRTSCPRLSIWEDACLEGLVAREAGVVSVTPKGRALLSR